MMAWAVTIREVGAAPQIATRIMGAPAEMIMEYLRKVFETNTLPIMVIDPMNELEKGERIWEP